MQRINPRSDSYEALLWDICCNAHRYTPKFGDRVLDLGAHFGMFSLYCAARGCQVTAFEPATDAYNELCHSAAVASEIGLGIIDPIPYAVWTSDGIAELFSRSDSSAAKTLLPTPHERQVVKCVTLRTALGVEVWDCVKLDIEGSEYEVFRVAEQEDLDRIKFLTMEIHNDLLAKEQREELIAKLIGAFPEHEMIPVKVNGQPTGDVATLLCWR